MQVSRILLSEKIVRVYFFCTSRSCVARKQLLKDLFLKNAAKTFLGVVKVCTLFLCVTQLSVMPLYAVVRLEITDSDGLKIEHAGAGQPFRVSVETDARTINSKPIIEGLDAFLCEGTSFREMTTPTAKLSRFGYVARIDQPGSYTIGPARIKVDGHEETSGVIHLEVKQEVKTVGSSTKNQHKPFAQLSVSPSEVFAYEPVTCTLRFYFSRGNVRDVSAQLAEVHDTVIVDQKEAQQGTEIIDEHQWNYVEWSWRLYSKQSGNITLPACSLQYKEVESGGFFFAQLQHKQLYSNAVTFQVTALPQSDEPLQAVGVFDRLVAQVDQSVVRAGDAFILTVRVEGNGFFEESHPFVVQKIPDAFKWYESKKHVLDPEHDGVAGKAFEFVIQGSREGEWQIPEQYFVYFDTNKREYRTLVSSPLQVTITPGQLVSATVPAEPQIPTSFVVSTAEELSPSLSDDGFSWWALAQKALPWWLMLVLVLLPSVVVVIALIRRRLLQTPLVRKKTIFSSARQELAVIIRRGEVRELHPLFTRLFARLYDDPALDIMGERLQERLRDAGLKTETLERWQEFVERCAECAFYPASSATMSKEALLVVAEQWLLFFKERL